MRSLWVRVRSGRLVTRGGGSYPSVARPHAMPPGPPHGRPANDFRARDDGMLRERTPLGFSASSLFSGRHARFPVLESLAGWRKSQQMCFQSQC